MSDQPRGPRRYGTTPVDPDDVVALVDGVVVSTKSELDELEATWLVCGRPVPSS